MDNLDINTLNTLKSNGETFESLFGETTDIIIDREKQIEEIAKVMCGGCPDNKECMHCLCADWYKAESLYNAGYRKQSEVAKEIFAEIDERIGFLKNYGYVNFIAQNIFEILDEVKRKYTEESGNDR